MKTIVAEYIWIDGTQPTSKLRSKTKIFNSTFSYAGSEEKDAMLSYFPDWTYDGSSTNQALGSSSDVILKPVAVCPDPLRPTISGVEYYLVMCQTFNANGSPNFTNHFYNLNEIFHKFSPHKPWVGFEQEYVLIKNGKPLGFPVDGYPGPQGPYYCGVGSNEAFGREIVEEHMTACLKAGIGLTGINAEVMPGQWEYQIFGSDILRACHEVWLARWLLCRISEKYGVSVSLEPKVVFGDWNGSGMHTNFSIKEMREGLTLKSGQSMTGLEVIELACKFLSADPKRNLEVYGAGNQNRLTGHHETCSINEFRYGVANRGASIRIPLQVSLDGKGYLEDRRPAANADPYQVCQVLLSTIIQPFQEFITHS